MAPARPTTPTSDQAKPATSSAHVAALDGLRAVAILLVFAHHAFKEDAPGRLAVAGDIGVTVFFVLSGYLLFLPFVRRLLGGEELPGTAAYALRRFARVMPAYWVALLLIGLPASPAEHWQSFLLLQTLDPEVVYAVIPTGWSLAVEVAFYALLPLMALALLGRLRHEHDPGRRARRCLVLLLALLAACLALRVAILLTFGNTIAVWHNLSGLGAWFVAGMLVAYARAVRWGPDTGPAGVRALARRPVAAWGAAAGLFVVLTLALGSEGPWDPLRPPETTILADLGEHVGYLLFSVLVVAPIALAPQRTSPVHRLLASPPVAFVGLVSYGVFLWHVAILEKLPQLVPVLDSQLLRAPVALAVSVALGLASYKLIEEPLIRRAKGRSGRSRSHRPGVAEPAPAPSPS